MEVSKLLAVLALFLLSLITKIFKLRKHPNLHHLPPGTTGWPIVGETFEFRRRSIEGSISRFIQDRMLKYDSRVFKTSLIGNLIAVFCGPAGNKFLFSNENKNVQVWWPSSVRKLLRQSLVNKVGDEAKLTKKLLLSFLNAEALRNFVPKMDTVAQQHIKTHWEGKEQVLVYTIIQRYTFDLACSLFLSIEDSQVPNLYSTFDEFLKGIITFSINLPGTKFHRAMKAANAITKEIKLIIKKRKVDLEEKRVSPTQDLLSNLLVTSDTNGRFLTENGD
uniref:Cytochrome P450 n=1 Tax=Lotus japonicus TaxID=34305 RepID=I3SVM1_LOTJA|nr:unknown [Lotus japonicus]